MLHQQTLQVWHLQAWHVVLGLGVVGFVLLLGALQVAELLSGVVAIGLTLQTVKQGTGNGGGLLS